MVSQWALAFGGPLTGFLLFLAHREEAHPMIAWAALLPLLHALDQLRHDGASRFAHGFVAGLASSVAVLGPPWQPAVEGEASGPLAWLARADLASAGGWLLIAASVGVFAIGLGPALRSSSPSRLVWTAPALWTALELLRGSLCPVRLPWLEGWMALGYSIPPEAPAAHVVEWVGIHGLSFLLCTAAVALTLALRPLPVRQQILWAALGCALPLATQALGARLIGRDGDLAEPVPVTLLSAREESSALVAGALTPRPGVAPRLVVWPTSPAGAPAVALPQDTSLLRLAAGRPLLESPGRPPLEAVAPLAALPWTRGALVVGGDADLQTPAVARRLTGLGPGLLVALDEAAMGSPAQERYRVTMLRYRALETRRWLVRIRGPQALVCNPQGELPLDLHGIEGAGHAEVQLLAGETGYTRWGRLGEGAIVLLGAVSAGATLRRRRADCR